MTWGLSAIGLGIMALGTVAGLALIAIADHAISDEHSPQAHERKRDVRITDQPAHRHRGRSTAETPIISETNTLKASVLAQTRSFAILLGQTQARVEELSAEAEHLGVDQVEISVTIESGIKHGRNLETDRKDRQNSGKKGRRISASMPKR